MDERIVSLRGSMRALSAAGSTGKLSGPMFKVAHTLIQFLAGTIESLQAEGKKVEQVSVSTPLFNMLAGLALHADPPMSPQKVKTLTLTFPSGKVPVISIPGEPRREIIIWKRLDENGELVSLKKWYGGTHHDRTRTSESGAPEYHEREEAP